MPKPSVGRIVHVLADPKHNNGSDVALAHITRVWGDDCVNLRVTYDGPSAAPEGRYDWVTSWALHESREALEAHCAAKRENSGWAGPDWGAFWPPSVA